MYEITELIIYLYKFFTYLVLFIWDRDTYFELFFFTRVINPEPILHCVLNWIFANCDIIICVWTKWYVCCNRPLIPSLLCTCACLNYLGAKFSTMWHLWEAKCLIQIDKPVFWLLNLVVESYQHWICQTQVLYMITIHYCDFRIYYITSHFVTFTVIFYYTCIT